MLWVAIRLPSSKFIQIAFVLFVLKAHVSNGIDDQFKTVDIIRLANNTHGTELALFDNAYKIEKAYNIDDFFWTGSGDGPIDNNEQPYETSTIYKTQTVLSTIYIRKPATGANNQSTDATTTTACTFNCDGPSVPKGEINPTATTPTAVNTINNTGDGDYDEIADRQFWLLTVLKSDGKDPVILDLKNNLAKLYKTAFSRQQERHLGINNRRKRAPDVKEPVNVYIHNVAKSQNGEEKIEVLYHVSVAGKPVDAVTAAADMTLVSDEEVINELGYPFVVKAEPYLKPSEPQELVKANNTWLFIGSSLSILILLLLAVAFISLCLNKRKRNEMGTENRQQAFNGTGSGAQNNLGFENDREKRKQSKVQSSTYVNFKRESLTQHDQGVSVQSRPGSSISFTTTSGSSFDISPLMGLHNQQSRTSSKKKTLKSRPVSNKTIPLMPEENRTFAADSDSSSSRESPDTVYVGRYDNGITSPKSYLSMPSVKSFPSRGNMPEPLNKVLEPVSVLHLDLHEDGDPEFNQQLPKKYRQTALVRHGSVGTDEDPGVVGPVVWNMHCRRLQHGVSVDEGINDMRTTAHNMNRMRKRFHDLLDDTFSLFGSRRDSPVEEIRPAPIEVKSHSAITSLNSKDDDDVQATVRPRPKTSEPRKILLLQAPFNETVKGAWTSKAPSPSVRPSSAGLFPGVVTPRVDVDLVLADGRFQANDPAVPLIAAIKGEIDKCTLPGSTSNLRE